MIGEHIKATQPQFESVLDQIKRDYEGKTKDLRAELEAVNVMLGIEQRRDDAAPPAPQQSLPQPLAQAAKSPRPLSGMLMRRAG